MRKKKDNLEEIIYSGNYNGLFKYSNFEEYIESWKDIKPLSKNGKYTELEQVYHIIMFNVGVHYEARKNKWAKVTLTGKEIDRDIVKRKILNDAKKKNYI